MSPQKWINLRRLFKYTSPIIDLLEKPYLHKYGNRTSEFPTIYIVGAPRTGSTILYQLITNYLDVLYVDNLAELARNNLFFGISLSQLIYKNKQHNSLYSDHGKTHDSGLHAPNEGLFWYRWLPPKKHYTTRNDLTKLQKTRIQQYHNAVKNKFEKPLVIKNLSFGMRLDLLHEIDKTAKIIYVKRDLFYVVQSILKAKQKESWPENKIWSIKPKNYQALEKMSPIEQVVEQVYRIEMQIEQDLKMFDDRVMRIQYEDLTDNYQKYMEMIAAFIQSPSLLKTNRISEAVPIKNMNQITLDKELTQKIKTLISQNHHEREF